MATMGVAFNRAEQKVIKETSHYVITKDVIVNKEDGKLSLDMSWIPFILVNVAILGACIFGVYFSCTHYPAPSGWGDFICFCSVFGIICVLVILGFSLYAFFTDCVERDLYGSKKLASLKYWIEKSSKGWRQYANNLDYLLAIRTVNCPDGLYLNSFVSGLLLTEHGELLIDTQAYDWYILDKVQGKEVFKVVGWHKKEFGNILVYLLGKDDATSQPYLLGIPTSCIEVSCEECMKNVVRKDGKLGWVFAEPSPNCRSEVWERMLSY